MSMHTKEELSLRIEQYVSSIPYPAEPERLYAPISYAMEGGGKRLRPLLVLMSCNVFSADVERALPAAGAIEMFHTFTLLHDDIMDNAEVRRARPTVHKHWDPNTAILSGDAMVICAYRQLQLSPAATLPGIFAEFNKLAIEVCEGQQYDMDFESLDTVTLDEYLNMIRLKTAVLMAGACKIGALAGGAGEQECQAMYDFGLQLGMAYQLQDDYLDTYGTPETLGKNIGGDIAESKKTFLAITAINEAGEATRRAMISSFHDHSLPLPQKISRIRTIYNSLDIPAITRNAIDGYMTAAQEALGRLGVPEERSAPLRDLLDMIRNRDK